MTHKKRRLSIKTRVTLFYTLLVLFTCSVMLLLFFSGMQQTIRAYDEDLLLEAMASAAQTVTYQNGLPAMRTQDAVDFGRVSFALFDEGGDLWRGQWPPFSLPFEDGVVRALTDSAGAGRLVQDYRIPLPEGTLWLRGHIALDDMQFLRHTSAQRMLLILPILLALCAFGGYLLTRRAFSPIARMARQADSIAGGQDLSRRFDTGASQRPDEIGQLAATFNHMFARLEAAFERERQFTDDASHELRTPIAVITAACDYALAQDDPQESREALAAIRSKADAMHAMLAQLLQLARMDAGRVALAREPVDLSRLCRETALELGEARGIPVDTTAVVPGLSLVGDELLLMRMVVNVLDNACKFARSRVSIALCAQGEQLALRVEDDGHGMTPDAAARCFDRFYQAAPDRSAQNPGAGLGLPMARGIARLHGGDMDVERTGAQGTCMKILLPKG